MTSYQSLLPENANELEKRAAEALAEIRRVPIPLRDLLSPERCPEHLLPYLAWSFSVDRWHTSWPAETKRKAIKDAYFVHAHKGTIGALRRIVETLGYALDINEWWQQEPAGTPGTFSIGIDQRDLPMGTSCSVARFALRRAQPALSRRSAQQPCSHSKLWSRMLYPGPPSSLTRKSQLLHLVRAMKGKPV